MAKDCVSLVEVYELLFEAYGPQHWWPADTNFEICVGAILTQQTSWGNVEMAIRSLKHSGLLSCRSICDASPDVVEKHVFSTGFYRQKTARLRDFCLHLHRNHSCNEENLLSAPLKTARNELLSMKGIGRETADSMLLYAGNHPVFVVDAYTCRMLSRITGKEHRDYGEVQSLFHAVVPRDVGIYREYHALVVEHGKQACTKNRPLCEKCPLEHTCFMRQNIL